MTFYIMVAQVLHTLAEVAHDDGDDDSARSLAKQSLALSIEMNREDIAASCLVLLASIAIRSRAPEDAARLLGVTAPMIEGMGSLVHEDPDLRLSRHGELVTRVRGQLDAGTFSEAFHEGRILTIEQAASRVQQGRCTPECPGTRIRLGIEKRSSDLVSFMQQAILRPD